MNKFIFLVFFLFSSISYSESYSDSKRISLIDGEAHFSGYIVNGGCSILFNNNKGMNISNDFFSDNYVYLEESIPVFFTFSSCSPFVYKTLSLSFINGSNNKRMFFDRVGNIEFVNESKQNLTDMAFLDKKKISIGNDIYYINITSHVNGYKSFLNKLNNTAIFLLTYP